MTTPSNKIKKDTDNSNSSIIDFTPPENSYLQHEQFTSAFFRDHNEEQYQIQRAFKPNNYTYLRSKIPTQLKHGAILQERLAKVQQNVEGEAVNRSRPLPSKQEQRKQQIARKRMQQIGKLGYFQVFPYQESLYGLQHELQLREKQKAKRAQEEISRLDFRPAGFDKKMKYQNPFEYVDRIDGSGNKQDYIFPFHIPQDTFDRFHECELRTRIVQDAGKIAGEFIPSKNQKSLSKVSRSKSVEIIKDIEVYLKRFAPSIGFFIGINKKDYIDILFQEGFSEDNRLAMLMSRICESQQLSKYQLRRNTGKWGRIGESGYLQFCLFPPWVREIQEKLVRE